MLYFLCPCDDAGCKITLISFINHCSFKKENHFFLIITTLSENLFPIMKFGVEFKETRNFAQTLSYLDGQIQT